MQRINYQFTELRALISLYESHSFIKSAEQQHITQSAFSRRIARLEESIQGALVERSTRRVAFTALGQELVERVEPLLEQLDAAVQAIGAKARGESGCIVVASLASVAHSIFPLALRRFGAVHPGVALHLRDDSNERVLQAVLSREAEFGVCAMTKYPRDIVAQFCMEDTYVVAFPIDHPLEKSDTVHWRDLNDYRVVGMRATNLNRKLIDRRLATAGIPLPWVDEVEYLSSMLGLLQEGGAIGVLPGLAIGLPNTSKLQVRRLSHPRITRRISLIRRGDTRLSIAGLAFWNALHTELAAAARPR